jgi:hypothetical protein
MLCILGTHHVNIDKIHTIYASEMRSCDTSGADGMAFIFWCCGVLQSVTIASVFPRVLYG